MKSAVTRPIPSLTTVVITVHADAFLRGMMRSFTGALVKIGQGRATPEWLGSLVDTATMRDPSVTRSRPLAACTSGRCATNPLQEELAA